MQALLDEDETQTQDHQDGRVVECDSTNYFRLHESHGKDSKG